MTPWSPTVHCDSPASGCPAWSPWLPWPGWSSSPPSAGAGGSAASGRRLSCVCAGGAPAPIWLVWRPPPPPPPPPPHHSRSRSRCSTGDFRSWRRRGGRRDQPRTDWEKTTFSLTRRERQEILDTFSKIKIKRKGGELNGSFPNLTGAEITSLEVWAALCGGSPAVWRPVSWPHTSVQVNWPSATRWQQTGQTTKCEATSEIEL